MRLIPDAVWAAMTIWGEARGEPFMGKVGVARVIRNRMRDTGHDVVDVVLAPHQFSCWSTDDPNRLKAAVLDDGDAMYSDCVRAWDVSDANDGGVGDAVFYINPAAVKTMPGWAKPENRTAIVGNHQFFVG